MATNANSEQKNKIKVDERVDAELKNARVDAELKTVVSTQLGQEEEHFLEVGVVPHQVTFRSSRSQSGS
jgi:hypothetical protein